MDEGHHVQKAATIVGGATLISRILGYVRDMVVAAFFGAGYYSDVFIAAFRVPNLLRRLFAEGSLTMAFIPVFTGYLTRRNERDAFGLARSALRLLTLISVGLTLLGILLAPLIVKGIAFGFAESVGGYHRYCFFGISLYALFSFVLKNPGIEYFLNMIYRRGKKA